MKGYSIIVLLIFITGSSFSQNVGIIRNNYISTYYDSMLMTDIEVLDSATIQLGSINPVTGVVLPIGSTAYNSGINLNGATLNPYANQYYIGSGMNMLTFDMNSGDITNNVPISGSLPSSSFQNIRFNPIDTIIYGMVPNNFYSSYFDTILMSTIEVLDSTQIRFGSLNPNSGAYSLIGNASFGNIYTLAGNSIDPYQMVYYYSTVTSLIGVDIYTGNVFSAVPIQVPPTTIFENITYSCADTAIYGITRQNFISSYYDPFLMIDLAVLDSTTFRLSRINPNTGEVTFVSPYNIGVGGNLTGGSFIDPNTMTFFFSHGNQIVGVSLITGLITSSVERTFPDGGFTFDMMRSSMNCYGALRMRENTASLAENTETMFNVTLYPNPVNNVLSFLVDSPINKVVILDCKGVLMFETNQQSINIDNLPSGIYIAKVWLSNGAMAVKKFVKN